MNRGESDFHPRSLLFCMKPEISKKKRKGKRQVSITQGKIHDFGRKLKYATGKSDPHIPVLSLFCVARAQDDKMIGNLEIHLSPGS